MDWYTSELPRRIAQAYDLAEHNPANAYVERCYDAFKRETSAQFRSITRGAGIRVEFVAVDPYASTSEMVRRVRLERTLYIYTGDDMPLDHPLKGFANLEFRAVHDWYGHIATGNSFRAAGEELAFRAHARMYSADALPALATETRGQNCWSNFGSHLPFDARTEWDYVRLPANRPFAPQKATILPAFAWGIR